MLCNSTILKQDKTKFIYGAEWAGTENPAWVRTDNAINFEDPQPAVAGGTGSSPFDNIMPWSGMVRITNPEAGEVVAIPKFYCKWTQTDSKLKLQISMYQYPGFICSPAHMDRGDGKGERDVVYVGRYYCSNASDTNHKSVTNAKPWNTYIKNMINTVNNLSNTIWTLDFATLVTIQMLYLVEFATWDSQAVIGRGNNIAQANMQNTGTTDSMQYHTGTMQTSRDIIGNGIQYRYIEDLWSNALTPIVGCYANTIVNDKNVAIGYELKVATNPTHFTPLINSEGHSYFSGGTTIATENDTSVAYSESLAKSIKISNIESLNWAYFVNSSVTIDNNYHKYLCDTQYMDFTSANNRDTLELGKGGSGDDALGYGLFNLGLDDINSSGVESIRLMILP